MSCFSSKDLMEEYVQFCRRKSQTHRTLQHHAPDHHGRLDHVDASRASSSFFVDSTALLDSDEASEPMFQPWCGPSARPWQSVSSTEASSAGAHEDAPRLVDNFDAGGTDDGEDSDDDADDVLLTATPALSQSAHLSARLCTSPPRRGRHLDDPVPWNTSPPDRVILRNALADLDEDTRRRTLHRRVTHPQDDAYHVADVDKLVRRGRGLYGPKTHFNGLPSTASSQLTLGTLNANRPGARAVQFYREGVREVCGVDPAALHDAHHVRRCHVWAPARLTPPLFGDPGTQPARESTSAGETKGSRGGGVAARVWNSSTSVSTCTSQTAVSASVASALYRRSSPQRARAAVNDEDLYDQATGVSLKATEIPARYFTRWAPYVTAAAPHTAFAGRGRICRAQDGDAQPSAAQVGPTARLAGGDGALDTDMRTPRRQQWAYRDGPSLPAQVHDWTHWTSTPTSASPSSSSSSRSSSKATADVPRAAPTLTHRRHIKVNAHMDARREETSATAQRSLRQHVASRYVRQSRVSREAGLALTLHETLGLDVSARPSAIVPSHWRLSRAANASPPSSPSIAPLSPPTTPHSAEHPHVDHDEHNGTHVNSTVNRCVSLHRSRRSALPSSISPQRAESPSTTQVHSTIHEAAGWTRERHGHRTRRDADLVHSGCQSFGDEDLQSKRGIARARPAPPQSLSAHRGRSDRRHTDPHVAAHQRVFPFPPLLTPLLLEVDACLHAHALGSVLDIWRASRATQDQLLQAVGFHRASERKTILWELERMTRNTSSTCVL